MTGRGQTAGSDRWAVGVGTSLPAEASTCGDGETQVGWSIVAKYHQKSLESTVTEVVTARVSGRGQLRPSGTFTHTVGAPVTRD